MDDEEDHTTPEQKDARNRAKFEQGVAFVADYMPLMWWRIFGNCKGAGFTDHQSFMLTVTYILSQCPNGIRPPE